MKTIGDLVEQERAQFDTLGFILAYENGELEHDAVVDGFQSLIDSGLAWQLQGHYGRVAASLIETGYCAAVGDRHA